MRLLHTSGAMIVLTLAPLPVLADQVNRLGGGQVIGKVDSLTPNEVVVTTGKKTEKVPVNVIESIRFDNEPPQMIVLRSNVRNGNYRVALETLNALDTATVSNVRVKDELLYYRALVTAKQALASGNPEQLRKGGTALTEYLKQNKTSWHLYEAVEVIGDVYVALAALLPDSEKKNAYQYADAEYQKLAAAPWDGYKLRAAIARARAFQQSGQLDQAKQHYQDAIRLGTGKGDSASAADLVLSARVGLANVLAESSPAEAIKVVTEVLAGADPENTRLHALGFLTLGKCHDKAKNPKEALMNFLKVDVLYFAQADCHAEALYYLSRLWNEANLPDRAKEAAEKLKSRYPNSLFAGKLPK